MPLLLEDVEKDQGLNAPGTITHHQGHLPETVCAERERVTSATSPTVVMDHKTQK